jgi:hypothetical protein
MKLSDDDFTLFGLPQVQALDRRRWTRGGVICRPRCTPTALLPKAPPRSAWPCNGPCV